MSRYFGNKDVLSGLMFIAFGAAFYLFAREYNLGTAAKMGPGYFPRVLGIILLVIGAIVCLGGFLQVRKDSGEEAVKWEIMPLLYISVAVGVFGLALVYLGLLAAIFLLCIISGAAAHDREWKSLVYVSIGLAIGCALVFVLGLGLQMPIFPWSK
jgi:NADH:ubiquinone oxidoreductase subunit 4 (subunit M)